MPEADTVGVIVGRFQEHELHEGHRHLITIVCQRHSHVLILLGVSRAYPTNRDPLSFQMRETMIRNSFPSRRFTILPLESDRRDYRERSEKIDQLIAAACGRSNARIYGSRDSVVHKYHGRYPTEEIETVFQSSASAIRNSLQPTDSVNFRAGIVYALAQRPPIAYPAVDIAIVDFGAEEDSIILVGKPDEDLWRFPGGFFDPEVDTCFEDAAAREGGEEVLGVRFERPQMIRSHLVDDWRYRGSGSKDRIVTTLTLSKYISGEPRGGDDVNRARKFLMKEFTPELIVPEHRPLRELLLAHLYR